MTNNENSGSSDDYVVIDNLNEISDFIFDESKKYVINHDKISGNAIEQLCSENPHVDFILAAQHITKETVLFANKCGVRNVIPVSELNNSRNINFVSVVKEKDNEPDLDIAYIKGMKVMLVDDEDANNKLLSVILNDFELEMKIFNDPCAAADSIDTEPFDLFLFDIRMPGYSGFDLADIAKKSKYNSNVPIMFISACDQDEARIKAYISGSCAYIDKPYNFNILRAQISSILKNKKQNDVKFKILEDSTAIANHDIKSMIANCINGLRLVVEKRLPNSINKNETLKDVLATLNSVLVLINNILHNYKDKKGKNILMPTYISLSALIKDVIKAAKYNANERETELIFECKVSEDRLFVDGVLIARVVTNLVDNAIKYSCRKSKIYINLSENRESIVFSIENKTVNTIHDTEKIFDQNITYGNKYCNDGTGLGLYIAKSIILAHNGYICAENLPGSKIKFTFKLPKHKQTYIQ